MSSSYLKTKCNKCGSPTVNYSPDKSSLVCNNKSCGYVEKLPRNKDSITEKKLDEGFDFSNVEKGLGKNFKGEVCLNCGAFVAIAKNLEWKSCPFCSSESGEAFRGEIKTIKPSSILPFNYPKFKAEATFRSWARGIFAPGSLIRAARNPHVKGIYIPFWNFEVLTRSSWKAVQVSEGAKGKKSKQPVQGFFEHFFDDVRLFASEQLDPLAWESLGTYPLDQAVAYDPKYLESMHTEIVQRDLKQVVKSAEKTLEKRIRDQISKKAKKKSFQNMSVRSQKQLLDARLMLLPVWIATYGPPDELDRVLINGVNGEMMAERPYSTIKVALGVLIAVVGLIGLIILLNKLF